MPLSYSTFILINGYLTSVHMFWISLFYMGLLLQGFAFLDRPNSCTYISLYIWAGTPQKVEFIDKKCVFILTCLNFSHLQSTLYVMQYTYWDVSPTVKTVFELVHTDVFLCFCHFFSPLPHQQNVFLWGLLHLEETKKKLLMVKLSEWRGWSMGLMSFSVKNCWTISVVWADCLINRPS